MGIESFLVFCVLLSSIGSSITVILVLRDIEGEVKRLVLANDRTNERLDRLIDTAMSSINHISKSIQDINKKID